MNDDRFIVGFDNCEWSIDPILGFHIDHDTRRMVVQSTESGLSGIPVTVEENIDEFLIDNAHFYVYDTQENEKINRNNLYESSLYKWIIERND